MIHSYRLILLFLILAGCRSVPTSEKSMHQLLFSIEDYKKAKSIINSNPVESCQIFSRILNSPINPSLKTLAELRLKIHCTIGASPAYESTANNLSAQSEESIKYQTVYPKWFEDLNIESRLTEADKKNDPLLLTLAYKDKARLSNRNQEKLLLLQKSMEFAKKTTNLELQNQIQQNIYRIAPRLTPNPQSTDFLRVAQDFMLQREFEKAREFYRKIIHNSTSPIEEKYASFKQYRNSFKIDQLKSDYLKSGKELLDWVLSKKNYIWINEAYINLARAEWTEGNVVKAKFYLNEAKKLLKNHYPLDEIYYIQGKIFDEENQLEKAIEYFKFAVSETKNESLLKEKILFSMAWDYKKQKKYDEAATQFSQLQKITQDTFALFRYQFWEAECWRRTGQVETSIVLFKKLIMDDPLGYYGLLAYERLDFPIPALGNLMQAQKKQDDFQLSSEIRNNVLIFTKAEEPEVLQKYISEVVPDIKKLDTNSAIFILSSLAESGIYQPLFSNLSLFDTQKRKEIIDNNPELLFPRKFLDLISTQANKFSIQPEFILSIIRQESSFDPHARSPVDAFGLMQVLPTVAKVQEKIAQVQIYHHEDLYKPEINIPIGTSLISRLLTKYKGQMLLTAAAYNANEKAISNWLKTRYQGEPIDFIEDIPYEETRSYMKLILRNFIFYSRLARPDQDIKFPKQFFQGFDDVIR